MYSPAWRAELWAWATCCKAAKGAAGIIARGLRSQGWQRLCAALVSKTRETMRPGARGVNGVARDHRARGIRGQGASALTSDDWSYVLERSRTVDLVMVVVGSVNFDGDGDFGGRRWQPASGHPSRNCQKV